MLKTVSAVPETRNGIRQTIALPVSAASGLERERGAHRAEKKHHEPRVFLYPASKARADKRAEKSARCLHNEHLAVKLDAEGGVHHVGIRAKEVEARKEEVDKRREQDEKQKLPLPYEIGKALGDISEDVLFLRRFSLRIRNWREKHFRNGGQKERERIEEQCPAHADPPHEQHTGHRPRDFYDLSPAVADGIIHADAFTVDHLTDDGAVRRRVEGVHNGKQSVAAMTTSAMRGEATKKLTARHMAAERTSVTMRIFFRLPLSAFAPPIRLNTICMTVSELW